MLDEIVDKNNKTFHRIIKLKPADVKKDIYIYIDDDVEHNGKDVKFKVGDYIRIPKYKNIFQYFSKLV